MEQLQLLVKIVVTVLITLACLGLYTIISFLFS